MTQVPNYAVPPGTRASVRQGINAVLAALRDDNAGPTAPPNPVPGMMWLDTSTTPPTPRRRNAGNTAWQAEMNGALMTANALSEFTAPQRVTARENLIGTTALMGLQHINPNTFYTAPASANLLGSPNDMATPPWSLAEMTRTDLGGGVVRVTPTAVSAQHFFTQNNYVSGAAWPDNAVFTQSVELRAQSGANFGWARFTARTKVPAFPEVYVNLATGAIVTSNTTNASAIVLPDGFVRVQFSFNSGTGIGQPQINILPSTSSAFAGQTFVGNGTGLDIRNPIVQQGAAIVGSAVPATAAQLRQAAGLSGHFARNAIINGNFAVNQRGASGTVTLAAGAYGHDRWRAGAAGCTYTFATVANVTTITIIAGSLLQIIEGANLFSGTYVLSWTGTAQGRIGAGSYGASGITGTATGGVNLNIEFNTGAVSLVQFEAGSIATPFERVDASLELLRCQRYLPALVTNAGAQALGHASFYTSTVALWAYQFKVPPRVPPTGVTVSSAHALTLIANGSSYASTAIIYAAASLEACELQITTPVVAVNAAALVRSTGAIRILFTGCEL